VVWWRDQLYNAKDVWLWNEPGGKRSLTGEGDRGLALKRGNQKNRQLPQREMGRREKTPSGDTNSCWNRGSYSHVPYAQENSGVLALTGAIP